MKLEILKGSLNKAGKVTVSGVKTDDLGETSDYHEGFKAPPHDDLKAAINKLAPHLAIISGYVKPAEIGDIETVDLDLFQKYHVSGFTIGPDDEDRWVILTGYVIVLGGAAQNLNTPMRRVEEKPESRYLFMDNLIDIISEVQAEILLYISGEKRGKAEPKRKQAAIEFPAKGKVTKAQILAPQNELDRIKENIVNDYNNGGKPDKKVQTGGIPSADPEAMERIKADDASENATKKAVKKNGKRVAQTAETRSGIIEDFESLDDNK